MTIYAGLDVSDKTTHICVVDAEGMVIAVTPANINDGRAGPDAIRAKGGTPRIVATGTWGRDEAETLKQLTDWNQPIHRMRWRGIAKAACQIHLTAIACNLKRTLNIMQPTR